MTVALFDTAQVGAVANAIRAKTGKTATMTVAEMPDEIASISGGDPYKEVWLHGPQQLQGALYIDTGVPGDMNHTLEVVGYGNIYASTVLFGSVTSAGCRQVVDMLTTNNRIRFAWANSGLKTYTYEITEWSAWRPLTARFNKNGFTLNGFNQPFTAVTLTGEWADSVTSEASTANYKVFPHISSADGGGSPGVFRSAKIFDSSDTLIHHFVPIMYNNWTLALRDKVTGNEISLLTGVNGYGAFWEPHTDTLVGLA